MKRTPYWIRKTHLMRADEFVCSECGVLSPKPYKVCRNCGTRLEKTSYSPSWVDEMEKFSSLMDDCEG